MFCDDQLIAEPRTKKKLMKKYWEYSSLEDQMPTSNFSKQKRRKSSQKGRLITANFGEIKV